MAPSVPPLRYLSADDVRAAMPPLDERLALAELTLTALATPGGAELPPKIAVHPRPAGSFAHAMPAHLRAAAEAHDLLGIKWIAGFGSNSARGLPTLHGLVILGHLLPGVELHVYDRHPDRAEALAAAGRDTPGIASASPARSAREAVDGADVVVTAASFGPVRQVMTNDWLVPHALVVPVDYATYCAAEVARDADLFLVDHRDQFLANREAGLFDDYPDPSAMLGEAINSATVRPKGRVVVSHLGVGLADVVFGDAIVRAAESRNLGVQLARQE